MPKVMRQMPPQVGREAQGCGEAALEASSDETCDPRHATQGTGTGSALLQAALTRENLQKVFKRARANKGAAGVDGLDRDPTAKHLASAWPDKELKGRGHSFVRYADDCNVYVGSQKAGERVMTALRAQYARLGLKVNETKSAVAKSLARAGRLGTAPLESDPAQAVAARHDDLS